jgi:hypothetical protein
VEAAALSSITSVSKAPKLKLPASLDHLIGAGEHGGRNVEAERVGGFEINDQFVLGRQLHPQVRGFLSTQNATDIDASLAELLRQRDGI